MCTSKFTLPYFDYSIIHYNPSDRELNLGCHYSGIMRITFSSLTDPWPSPLLRPATHCSSRGEELATPPASSRARPVRDWTITVDVSFHFVRVLLRGSFLFLNIMLSVF